MSATLLKPAFSYSSTIGTRAGVFPFHSGAVIYRFIHAPFDRPVPFWLEMTDHVLTAGVHIAQPISCGMRCGMFFMPLSPALKLQGLSFTALKRLPRALRGMLLSYRRLLDRDLVTPEVGIRLPRKWGFICSENGAKKNSPLLPGMHQFADKKFPFRIKGLKCVKFTHFKPEVLFSAEIHFALWGPDEVPSCLCLERSMAALIRFSFAVSASSSETGATTISAMASSIVRSANSIELRLRPT